MLTVADGGLVSAKTLYASLGDLHGNGTIMAAGAILDTNMVFDASHGTTQTMAFGSGGALNLAIDGTSYLGVGHRSGGSLRVADGIALTSSYSYLGYGEGTIGRAIVSGTGSTWSTNNDLWVGHSGDGTLTVTDGGSVTAKTLFAAPSDLHGNGTITASGAVVDADLVFDSTHGTTQILAFGSGGTLNLAVNGGALGTGFKGTGSLQISDGVALTSSYGFLGYRANSVGTATVSGAGSKWSNGLFYIGYHGNGTLRIENGGQVNSTSGAIGFYDDLPSVATVSGDGSMWTNSSGLSVGASGNGLLRIESGGQVSSSGGYLGSGSSESRGIVTVRGAGSTWTNSSDLYVGRYGTGALSIEAGGHVTSVNAYLGNEPGSTGTVAVSGAGSTWTNSGALFIGARSSGSLTVMDGGLVTAKTLFASLSDLHGNGTITASGGAVLDADLVFDSTHGTTQTLSFGSGGTLNLTVMNSGGLGAGYKGSGSLRIADGVVIGSSGGFLGYDTGSSGTATVSGVRTRWSNSGVLYVGNWGSGTLSIEDGGTLVSGSFPTSLSTYLGNNAGSSGTATVRGMTA